MRTAIIVLVVIIIIGAVWYFIINRKSTVPVISNIPPNNSALDYYVNGNDVHDKQVFQNGLACAKAFLYKNTSDPMARNIMTLNSLGGRGGGDQNACKVSGINCYATKAIGNLSASDSDTLLNYLSNLNPDSDYKVFSNLAVGKRNMCSVILEQALKTKLPGIWSTLGRG